MTPIKWVAPNEFYDHNRKPEGGGGDVPVITLTDLEAWLTDESQSSKTLNDMDTYTLDRLLAQVQAWKEGK